MQQVFRSFVVGLLLAVSTFHVLAAGLCYKWQVPNAPGVFAPTAEAACQAYAAKGANFVGGNPANFISVTNREGTEPSRLYAMCNVSFVSGGVTYSPQIQMFGDSGDCPTPACIAGTTKVFNFTTAWSRNDNTRADAVDGIVGKVQMPGLSYSSVCISDCQYSMDANSAIKGYVSKTPSAEGLYRLSVDAMTVNTGSQCNSNNTNGPAEQAAKPDPQPLKCPGFTGEVNGKKTCVGTASSPLPPPSGDTNLQQETFAKSGSTGNPAAGEIPQSGEGSGLNGASRTPSAGVGSASGGPISATGGSGSSGGSGGSSGGGGGSGTVTKPGDGQEQANCGAPGQPQCKIDETGTPSDFAQDKFSTTLDAAKSEAKSARDTISGSGDKGMFESMRSILTSAPPVVGCSPMVLPRDMGSIDPCPVVDGVRYVMSFLWAITGFWLCVRMVKQTV